MAHARLHDADPGGDVPVGRRVGARDRAQTRAAQHRAARRPRQAGHRRRRQRPGRRHARIGRRYGAGAGVHRPVEDGDRRGQQVDVAARVVPERAVQRVVDADAGLRPRVAQPTGHHRQLAAQRRQLAEELRPRLVAHVLHLALYRDGLRDNRRHLRHHRPTRRVQGRKKRAGRSGPADHQDHGQRHRHRHAPHASASHLHTPAQSEGPGGRGRAPGPPEVSAPSRSTRTITRPPASE